MPRSTPGIAAEFIPVQTQRKTPVVLCRHCKTARLPKSSSIRKISHLKRCEVYLSSLNGRPFPFQVEEGQDDEASPSASAGPRRSSTRHQQQHQGALVVAEPYWWPLGGELKAETTALVIVDAQRDFCEPFGYLAELGHPVASARAVIPPIQKVLHACRQANFAIYHARHSHRHDGSTLSHIDRARLRAPLPRPPRPVVPDGAAAALETAQPLPNPVPGAVGRLGYFLLRQSPGTDPVEQLQPLYNEHVIDHPRPSIFAYTDLDLLLRNRGIKHLILVGLSFGSSISATLADANDKGYDCLVVEAAVCPVSFGHTRPATEASVTGQPAVEGQTQKPPPLVDMSIEPEHARAAMLTALHGSTDVRGHHTPFGASTTLANLLPMLEQVVRPPTNSETGNYLTSSMTDPIDQINLSQGTAPSHAKVRAKATASTKITKPLSVPGGKHGAGGRAARGINNPIFYQPPGTTKKPATNSTSSQSAKPVAPRLQHEGQGVFSSKPPTASTSNELMSRPSREGEQPPWQVQTNGFKHYRPNIPHPAQASHGGPLPYPPSAHFGSTPGPWAPIAVRPEYPHPQPVPQPQQQPQPSAELNRFMDGVRQHAADDRGITSSQHMSNSSAPVSAAVRVEGGDAAPHRPGGTGVDGSVDGDDGGADGEDGEDLDEEAEVDGEEGEGEGEGDDNDNDEDEDMHDDDGDGDADGMETSDQLTGEDDGVMPDEGESA